MASTHPLMTEVVQCVEAGTGVDDIRERLRKLEQPAKAIADPQTLWELVSQLISFTTFLHESAGLTDAAQAVSLFVDGLIDQLDEQAAAHGEEASQKAARARMRQEKEKAALVPQGTGAALEPSRAVGISMRKK